MALITPTGILLDFELVFADPLPDGNTNIWRPESSIGSIGTIHTGTAHSGGVDAILPTSGNRLHVDAMRWDTRQSGDNRPQIGDFNPADTAGRNYDELETETPALSFYIFAASVVSELAVTDNTGTHPDDSNWIRWEDTVRPAGFTGGGTARMLIAHSGQATVVSNFVQGIGTPGQVATPTLTRGLKQLGVAWTAPTDTGGQTLSDYDVRYRVSGSGSAYTETTASGTSTTITGLADDTTYEVGVRATNPSGNGDWSTSATAKTYGPPSVPTGLAATPDDEELDVSWTASTPDGQAISQYRVRHRTGGGSWTSNTTTSTSYTITGLTNGTSYEVQVRAESSAGNSDYTASVTASPGDVPDAPTAPTLTNGTSGQLGAAWTAPANNGRAITGYTVRWRQVGTSQWSSGTINALSINITNLTNGLTYEVQVRATNSLGNGDYSPSATALVATAPEAATGLSATAGDTEVALSWTLNGNGGSALTALAVVYYETGDTSTTQTAAQTLTATSATITGLTNGQSYTFLVRKTNAIDTTDSATVATTPMSSDLMPTAPDVANQTGTFGVAFSVTLDVGTGGDPPLTYSVSGAPGWASFNTTTRVLSGTPDAAGTTTVMYIVTDDDGDSASDDFTITVSAVAPDAPVILTAQPGDGTVALTWDLGSDGGSPRTLVRVRHQASGGSGVFGPMLALDATSYTITNLTNGTAYAILVRVRNAIGTSNSAIIMRTPNAPPTAPTISDQAGTVNSAFSVTLTAGTGNATPLTYSVSGQPSWATFVPGTRVLSGTPDAAGTTTITYTVTDDNGNSDSTTFDVVIAADLTPIAPDVGNQAATEGVAFSVTLPVGTGGNTPLTYAVTGRPSWLNFNTTTRVLSGTPTAVATTALTYTVTDDDGDSDSDSFNIVVSSADLMPTLAAVNDQNVNWGVAFSLTLDAATGGDLPLTYTVTGRPLWLAFNATTRVLSGTPTGLAATTTLTYTVTDDDGDSASRDFDLTVNAVAPEAVTSLAATPGETTIALTWQQNGNGGAAITLQRVRYQETGETAQFLTVGNSATSATLTGLDTDTSYNILVSLTNSAGSTDSAAITASTTSADLEPTLPEIDDQAGKVNDAFSVTLDPAMSGNAPLTYSMADLPSWASFAPATRVLSGTPNAAGTTTVTYAVTDDDGDQDSVMFDLVIAADLMPTAPTVANQNTTRGATFSVTLPVGTGGDPPLTYAVSGQPAWASFNATTRVLLGVPNVSATTTVTYTVTDLDGDADSSTFNIIVADLMPTAPDIGNQTGKVGDVFSVTLDAGTGGDPPLTYAVSGEPSWASFNTSTRVLSGTPTAAGTTTVTYTVTDDDGDDDSDTFDIVIAADLMPTAPTIAAQTGEVGMAFSVTLTAGTGGDLPLTYSVSGQPSWATFASATRVLSGIPDAAATTTITYTVTDDDGDADSSTFTITIAAADVEPTAPDIPNQTGKVNDAFSVTLDPGTGGNAPLTYSVSGQPAWASFNASTRVLSGTPNVAATTSVTYTVTDDDGDADSDTFTITIAADLMPTAPTVPAQSGEVGTAFSVTLPVGTGGDAPLAYSVSGEPSWASFNTSTRVLSGTPTAATATTVTYTVTDDDGDADSSAFVITIAAADLTPTAPTIPNQNATVGVAFSVTLDVGTGGNIPLTYSVSGEPSWASFNNTTRVLSGTPDAAATTTVTYTVRDVDNDSDSSTFDIVVVDDPMPVLPAIANQNATVGTAFSVTLAAATGGDAPLTYALTGRPSWASFNASTRVLSGTPTTAGTNTLTYTVTDDDGDSDSVMFTLRSIIVDLTPSAPTILGQTGTINVSFSVTLDAGTGGDPPLFYTVMGLPSWATFTPATRVLSGTPDAVATTTVTYIVADVDGDSDDTTFTIAISMGATRPAMPVLPPSLIAGDGQIEAVWSPPGDGGSPIIDYLLRYRVGTGAWTNVTVTATSRIVTGLVIGTTYEFQYRARNSVDSGLYSRSAFGIPTPQAGDTLISFGAYSFVNNAYDRTTLDGLRQNSVDDNFAEVIPIMTRLPNTDGAFDEYGGGTAPQAPGTVRVSFWLLARHVPAMRAMRSGFARMAGYGLVALRRRALDGTIVECQARVNRIDWPRETGQAAHRQLMANVTFAVPSPGWRATTTTQFNDTSVADGDSLSVSVGGEAWIRPRIRVQRAAAPNITQVIIERQVGGVAIDRVTYDGTLDSNDTLRIDCERRTVEENGADAFADFGAESGAWIELDPNVANALVVELTPATATANIQIEYEARYYN